MLLNAYSVSCIIEKLQDFTDGKAIVAYQSMLMVHAKDEERVRQLIATWGENTVKIDIKEISKDGLTEEAEIVMKVYEIIIETRPII